MNKGFTPLLFYSETCAQPTKNGLESGFMGTGHSSPTSNLNATKLWYRKCHTGKRLIITLIRYGL
jgi:hypothetical protein